MTRRLTIEDITIKCNKLYGYKFDYSQIKEYKNAHIKVKIICPIHNEFFMTINNHYYNRRGCLKCKQEDIQQKDIIRKTKIFIDKSKIIHKNIFDYSKVIFVSSHKKVEIICSIHGSFWQIPAGHLKGKGCFDCYHDSRAIFPMHSLEEFIKKANEIHINKYDYTESIFEGLSALISIRCLDHGIFTQEASSHIKGSGCWKCAKKGTSKKEELWLDGYNISYSCRQVKFKINGKNIKADGFDPNTNTIYEFNGDFWHGNPDVFDPEDVNGCNQRTFGELYQKTIDRAKLIKTAGYNLIEVWEHDFDILMKERALKDDY